MDPHQPRRLREYLLLVAMMALVFGANAWAMWRQPAEQLSEPIAVSCRPLPVGGMQNRACLGA
jgi:hypothetical protein